MTVVAPFPLITPNKVFGEFVDDVRIVVEWTVPDSTK